MHIKNKFVKLLFKLFIAISLFECVYLFAVPPILNHFINKSFIPNLVSSKTNAKLVYSNAKIKTHIKPQLTLFVEDINVLDKQDDSIFLDADNVNLKIHLFNLLNRKLRFKHIFSDNLLINIQRAEDGEYNFQKLFPKKENKKFCFDFKNSNINIQKYDISYIDNLLNESFKLDGIPINIKTNQKDSTVYLKTKGQFTTANDVSDFDIDLKTQYPIDFKNFNNDNFDGKCFIYNLNLQPLFPIIQHYTNNEITKLSGIIDFIQISTNRNENNNNLVVLNTKFKNVIFDKKGWKNYITAKGENKLDTSLELYKNIIDVKSLNFKADKVNIKGNGLVSLYANQKPELDIHVEVNNSRVENIAPLLPPCIPVQYRTLEKVKQYGVFGDIDAQINAKGRVPQPDITGYVKGRNIHVLDESIHSLHKGTVDITFNKRILNMDILIDFFANQKATVKGYTYMFRDGINNVTIKTTDNIDFPLAQKIIIPVSKVFNFQLGPIPEMNITSGKGQIDLNVQGSMDYVNLNGFCNFDKAQLTYNGLYGEVLNGKGRLDFKGDTISFKSERAFVKTNPLSVDGKVRINKNLNFNISSNAAEAEDLLAIINNSELLKDVKEGLAIITDAKGNTKLFLNMVAKIVPVPYGHPPLPPDEAFEDMRVKGSLYLLGNTCKIEGFKTPIHSVKGIVDFTETETNLNEINGVSGTSPITITGNIYNDIETRIPEVDITITSKSVNLKDTIKFLTESYLYPENYPDLSPLYNIASKHDLLFKYKAKSVDFLTDKAYAEMKFIPDDTESSLKAKSGRVVMENAQVRVENINADLFDSTLKIDGIIKNVDTLNPIYNLDIKTNKFNLVNLDNIEKINVLPQEVKDIFCQFTDYQGSANVNIEIKNNILNGYVNLIKPQFKHIKSNIPFIFDDFNIYLKNNKLMINNVAAKIAEMPFFGNLTISDLCDNRNLSGFFTSKITNGFIKEYLPKEISEKITIIGDINASAKINGSVNNFILEPKITLFPNADVIVEDTSLGEINDKREFEGKFILNKDKISIKKFNYIKYISSQNNINYPVIFASLAGTFKVNKDNLIEPEEVTFKTNKNLSARVLNLFLKKPVLNQGTFNCDLKYTLDKISKTAKLTGVMDCRNIDIPLFDTLVKNVQLKASGNDINVNIFGFINDSKININSILENNIYETAKIHTLTIMADQIDNDKLLRSLSKARQAMNTNNEIKNINFSGINIENGSLYIKKLIIKSLIAENFAGDFSIDKNGLFTAKDIKINVGQGDINGNMSYDLTSSALNGDFELTNVDANYVAETLFDGKNQIYGNANGKIILETKGITEEDIIKNLNGFVYFDISEGRMPKLGSLEYLLRASNIMKSGITGFTINSILELLNLVKTGYFSNINGNCVIENGVAKNIEIMSKGENLSLYIHGSYDIQETHANMEILGKLSRKISTIFGTVGNTSLNTFFKLIPGISMLDYSNEDFIENVEKIPSFTHGDYEARTFQAIINGNINESGYVQSFKWVK